MKRIATLMILLIAMALPAAAAEHHSVQAFFHDFSSQTVDHRILSVKTRRPAGRLWYAVRWVPPPGGYSG